MHPKTFGFKPPTAWLGYVKTFKPYTFYGLKSIIIFSYLLLETVSYEARSEVEEQGFSLGGGSATYLEGVIEAHLRRAGGMKQ